MVAGQLVGRIYRHLFNFIVLRQFLTANGPHRRMT
jgi:hypothetical protein